MKEGKSLHVVAFNVPYPPDYGGIIDIFYKLKALHASGVKIILHAWVYERQSADKLNEICHQVHYYTRKTGPAFFVRPMPYIVATRSDEALDRNLLSDEHPVLFEGLHTTAPLKKCIERGKKVFVRTHNIEHNYYRMLAKSERIIYKKLFLRSEAEKLARYETILHSADAMLCISTTDTIYFNDKYGKSQHVSAFHQHEHISAKSGSGDYILFHGNLSVPENEKALLFLVKRVFSFINYRVVIAGKNPGSHIRRICDRFPHIELISNPDNEQMNDLVERAHINLLYTYQPTGLKLKLLHSLHAGRHCMANPLMLSGSGVESLCNIYRSPSEAIELIGELMKTPFPERTIGDREKKLKEYRNSANAKKITDLL